MTVSNTTSVAQFNGNGATVSWPIAFQFFKSTDLRVTKRSASGVITTLTLNTDYTVTGAGSLAGGDVITTVPLSTGEVLTVSRVMSVQQLTDLRNQGDYFAEIHEDVFDYLTMLIQQMGESDSRSLKYPVDGVNYQAEQRKITNLQDPVDPQDAATAKWTNQFVAALLSAVTGPINNSANILYVGPDGLSYTVQDLANKVSNLKGAYLVGYNGSNVGATLDGILSASRAQQNEVVSSTSFDNAGDLTTLAAAVASGTVNIAIAGDSIVEGLSQITYEDSPIGILQKVIREQNPGITFNFGNFSLAGRGIGELASPTYLGIAGPDNPGSGFFHAASSPVYSLWPNGSVIGKNWLNHVRDFAPDLFIIAHGMNNISGDGAAYASLLKTVITTAQAWTKAPSIALITTILPTRLDPTWLALQDQIQTTADATRAVSQELGITLLDVNRRYLLLRDAVDVVNKKNRQDSGFSGYPTGWTLTSGAGFANTGVLTGSGTLMRELKSDDIHLTVTFTLGNYSSQTAGLWYRIDDTSTDKYTVQIAAGNTVILYFNGSPFASQTFTALTNGTPVTLEINVKGARHQVFVGGVKMIDVYDYKRLRGGRHMLQIDGASGVINSYTAVMAVNYAFGRPQFTEKELLGINDFATNIDSVGGNAINHPTKLAASAAYAPAFIPLLHSVKAVANSLTKTVRASTANTAIAFDAPANQTLAMNIDGNLSPVTQAMATGQSQSFGSVESCVRVLGGRTISVSVTRNGTTTDMSTSVVLPSGYWSVRAIAIYSRNANGYAHRLGVEAIRTA